MTRNEILSLTNVCIGYNKTSLISNLNLKIYSGELIALVGPNGAGKTTLALSLLSIIPTISGEISIFNKSNPKYDTFKGRVSFVPQKFKLNSLVPITTYEFFKLHSKFDKENHLLNLFQLNSLFDLKIQSLSGGQLQKVLLCFAFFGNPDLVILDEALEGLDSKSQEHFNKFILNQVKNLNQTIIFISHDISAVSDLSTRAICINHDVLFDGSPKSSEFHSCLHKMYGEGSIIHDHSKSH